jgi:hypothetical protein
MIGTPLKKRSAEIRLQGLSPLHSDIESGVVSVNRHWGNELVLLRQQTKPSFPLVNCTFVALYL